MKLGMGLPNQVRNVDPTVIPRWAEQAEAAGFSALGTIGRTAYPGVQETVALAAAAAVTSRVELISGILIAPSWSPVLLAKEAAGIDGIANGRLTLGIAVGIRPDDFTDDRRGLAGRGTRLDADLETYRSVWNGEPVGGGPNPAVPAGTRQVPLLFGGQAPAAMARMARHGEGYVAGTVPAAMVKDSFDAARAAWQEAGRDGSPRLVALAYFALGAPEVAKGNVHDYYSASGEAVADLVTGTVSTDAAAIRAVVESFEEIGADQLILNPGTGDLDEIDRLAEIVF